MHTPGWMFKQMQVVMHSSPEASSGHALKDVAEDIGTVPKRDWKGTEC